MTKEERMSLTTILMDIVGEMGIDNDLDWSQTSTTAFESMQRIIDGVIDLYENWQDMTQDQREIIMLATISKLSVENFALNLHRLAGKNISKVLPI